MSAYAALSRAVYKAAVRDATTVFFTFAFPLIFLVIFALIFRNQEVADTGRGYVDYIAPGVLSWGLANAALFGVAFTLMQWRNDDLLRIIRLSPTSIWSVIGSRYVVALGIGAAQSVLFVGVAMLPVFGMRPDPTWPLSIPIMLLAVTAFLALGLIVGSAANTPEAVAAIANCIVVPMAFLSGSFYPLELMPTWLQEISRILPLRYVNDGITYAFTGFGTMTDYLVSCAALIVFTAVFVVVGVRTFRWSNDS
ncbi:ABC transporter permease [Salinispora arenicola]|uniref:ABC transporter permease n=1 Tax=Salinispora arenicola TaxID=168697 RepID=UPI00035E12FD|nr:ABC transporter permease [Salinispora arenicola]NIL43128.1 ABC transporter permease [Salinispora arenicola]